MNTVFFRSEEDSNLLFEEDIENESLDSDSLSYERMSESKTWIVKKI